MCRVSFRDLHAVFTSGDSSGVGIWFVGQLEEDIIPRAPVIASEKVGLGWVPGGVWRSKQGEGGALR